MYGKLTLATIVQELGHDALEIPRVRAAFVVRVGEEYERLQWHGSARIVIVGVDVGLHGLLSGIYCAGVAAESRRENGAKRDRELHLELQDILVSVGFSQIPIRRLTSATRDAATSRDGIPAAFIAIIFAKDVPCLR